MRIRTAFIWIRILNLKKKIPSFLNFLIRIRFFKIHIVLFYSQFLVFWLEFLIILKKCKFFNKFALNLLYLLFVKYKIFWVGSEPDDLIGYESGKNVWIRIRNTDQS